MNSTNKSSYELLLDDVKALIKELSPSLKKLSVGALKRLRRIIIKEGLENEFEEVLKEIERLLKELKEELEDELEEELEDDNSFSMRP